MATVLAGRRRRAEPIADDGYERALAIGSVVMLGFMAAALARGRAEWAQTPATVWAHLLTIGIALALTPAMLLRRRGDRAHRRLGRVWIAAMLATAAATLFIRLSHPGRFSPIHILSVWTLIQAPVIWWSARTHRVALHRGSVRGMVTGALLIAGFFTFPFGRLLGRWLFG